MVLALITSIVGVICLGAGIIGYFFKATGVLDRILLLGAAFLLIFPGILTDLGGATCIIAAFLLQKRSKLFHSRQPATTMEGK